MRRGLVGAIEDISMTERNLDPIEYVRLVVDTIQQDIGRTHVRVVASLAIIGVFLTKLKDVRTLDGLWQWPKFGGIGLLVLAALSYFQYTQELNKARIRIVKLLPDRYERTKSELIVARAPWEEFIKKPVGLRLGLDPLGWYRFAQFCFLSGSAALAFVLLRLVA